MPVSCTNCFSATEENPQYLSAEGKQLCAACWGAINNSFAAQEYSSPVYATSSALGVISDDGPFQHLAHAFVFRKNNYAAEVVASPKAIYLLKRAKIVHGIAGLIAGDAIVKEDHMYTCGTRDLPHRVQAALDPKNQYADHPVIVLQKETVNRVNAKFAGMVVRVGDDNFTLAYTVFTAGEKKRAMQEMGWQLNTDLTPTSAPSFDGRTTEERAARTGPSMVMRIALVLLAALVIMALALLKIMWMESRQ